MKRRGFIGLLAGLPFVPTALKAAPKAVEYNPDAPIDWPMTASEVLPGSGLLVFVNYRMLRPGFDYTFDDTEIAIHGWVLQPGDYLSIQEYGGGVVERVDRWVGEDALARTYVVPRLRRTSALFHG